MKTPNWSRAVKTEKRRR